MRLIRCHIENFGVLSDFDFAFSAGLTTICRPNGFGKSTFAAFIKAMLYGFPRTGARSIVENERKRYDPWQGGKYGGFLEFETGGTAYRVTRYFGKTAAKDTFSLIDLTTRQPSLRFSEKLGEELFQLDAESFARSTYMPQLQSGEMQATTSIRTKLSNLVDDTNDLNNYDTAEKKLREYRTQYRAYRGTGGSIQKLENRCHELDTQKFQAEQQKTQLHRLNEEIEALRGKMAAKTNAVHTLREKIRLASDQKSRSALQKQQQELLDSMEKSSRYLREMDENYPAGYPTGDEIKTGRENLSTIRQQEQRLQELTFSDADKKLLETEKQWFADAEKTAQDIEECDSWCKQLAGASAKLHAQMLPEELERLQALSQQFACGAPAEEELQACTEAADRLNAAQQQLAGLTVSAQEQQSLRELKELFQNGVPTQALLADCEQQQRERDLLAQSRAAHGLTEEEQKKYQALQRTFASGVPSEKEIHDQQNACRRIEALTAKKNTRTAVVQSTSPAAEQKASPMPTACGIAGVLLLAVGVACFVLGRSVPGILLVVAGFAALLGAFWLHTKSLLARTQGPQASVITASAITDEENQELYDLQHGLSDFLLHFYKDAAQPEEKLVQLLLDSRAFAELGQKISSAEEQLLDIDRKIEEKNQSLRAVFARYYPQDAYRDSFVQQLRESSRQYDQLIGQVRNVMNRRNNLEKEMAAYRASITALLQRYTPLILEKDLRQALRELADASRDYHSLTEKKQKMLQGNASDQALARSLKQKIQGTLNAYHALDPALPPDSCLQALRKRFEQYRQARDRLEHYWQEHRAAQTRKTQAENEIKQLLAKYRLQGDTPERLLDMADEDIRGRRDMQKTLADTRRKLAEFQEENPGITQAAEPQAEPLPDPEILQNAEQQLQNSLDQEMEPRLRELRQQRDRLRRVVESIPAWEDEMARLQAECEEQRKKCDLADQTLDLLRQAKDDLAGNYVGKVERGFEKYANTLLGNQLGTVMVDKDLKLYMDEKGAARELGSFSAGTADSMALCMRLALIDALFGKEKPFLILDDPFVNLDDAHTERALEMLKKIAQEQQVLYLVCNTSRQA